MRSWIYNLPKLFLVLSVLISSLSSAESNYFSDFYAEGHYLGNAKTLTGYSQIRGGQKIESPFELYAVTRIGADSRTLLETGNAVFTDNMLFLGAGIDAPINSLGLRPSVQIGYSFDLSDKISKSNWDARIGLFGFWALPIAKDLKTEFYTEAFWSRRLNNTFLAPQGRLFWSPLKIAKGELGPQLTIVASTDQKKRFDDRILEERIGLRYSSLESRIAVLVSPYWAWTQKWYRPTNGQKSSLDEFRFLIALQGEF
jgi:hypothetical protein